MAAQECSSSLNHSMSSALGVFPQYEHRCACLQLKPASWHYHSLVSILSLYHKENLGMPATLLSLSSQPCLSKPPLIQHSFHGKQTRANSILLISLTEHGYSRLANIPKRQAGYCAFQGKVLLESVLFLSTDLGKELSRLTVQMQTDNHPP